MQFYIIVFWAHFVRWCNDIYHTFVHSLTAIKFHELNKNKFQLRHKSVKESFIIYALIKNKDILYDFMLWDSRNDLEYNKKNITINISSRTIKERQKSTIDVIVMKIHLSSTKKMIYTLCERVIYNLHHLLFICFIDNFFTDSYFVKILLIFNVDICDIIQVNALDIFEELKIITAATKSQLKLKQWIHQIIDNVNCFVWKDVQKDHVVTFDITAYTSEASELTLRKSRFTIEIPLRNGARRIIIEQFIIAVQYNLYMNHVNRVNQLRTDLIISRPQQFKWIKKMIE